MPIRIPDALPATNLLASENIFVMTEYRAMHQDIRPLRVVLLNLMPTKIDTETQIMRKLSNTPLQVEITLLRMASHETAHTSQSHLDAFYRVFEDIAQDHFDGLIITGAPVEQLAFEQVDYWDELCAIMDWSKDHVHSTLHICWGAQAGIYYHYGIPKNELSEKVSGVFTHTCVKPTSPLLRGFDDSFKAPHSRYSKVDRAAIEAHPVLEILAESDEADIYIVKSVDSQNFFVFGHPEYDRDTLQREYERDCEEGIHPQLPKHYYPQDNASLAPHSEWRAHAQLLYTNWLNYYVYQTTPYDVRQAGKSLTSADAEDSCELKKSSSLDSAKSVSREYARPANEDDDGYDPWSDRRSEPPLFEPDPWR